MLAPTPPDRLCDATGHPYFLWDCGMTLEDFERAIRSPDREARAYHLGRLMRQAKPDDVFTFVSLRDIHDLWPLAVRLEGFKDWLIGRLLVEGAPPQ